MQQAGLYFRSAEQHLELETEQTKRKKYDLSTIQVAFLLYTIHLIWYIWDDS